MTAPATIATKDVQTGSDGTTVIADIVVAKIAGIATREVPGVHDLGGSTTRALGALIERIPGGRVNHSQGIDVEVGEKQAAIDIGIVTEYGVSLADVAATIRRSVIRAVEGMTGLAVTEVNITVHDVHLDGESDEAQGGASVNKADAPAPRVR